MKYKVTDIQRFCMHDGPGIRTTVFLKGCPLNCFWCHNPETKDPEARIMYRSAKCIGCRSCFGCVRGVHYESEGEHRLSYEDCLVCRECVDACPTGALTIVGRQMDGEEIIGEVMKDRAFYGDSGGLTLSGGEPMFHPQSCIELLRLAKENGLNTAIETCGFFPREYTARLREVTDLFLWDIKDTDNARHRANTGVSNQRIMENLRYADSLGAKIRLRCILLKGINLNDGHIRRLAEIYCSLENSVGLEFLPCHSLGNSKAAAVGLHTTDLADFEPSSEEVAMAEKLFKKYVSLIAGGGA